MDFFLAAVLKAIGIKETKRLKTTVVATDYDALQYVHAVKFTKYAVDKVQDTFGITKALNSVAGIISRFMDGGKQNEQKL